MWKVSPAAAGRPEPAPTSSITKITIIVEGLLATHGAFFFHKDSRSRNTNLETGDVTTYHVCSKKKGGCTAKATTIKKKMINEKGNLLYSQWIGAADLSETERSAGPADRSEHSDLSIFSLVIATVAVIYIKLHDRAMSDVSDHYVLCIKCL